MILHGEILKDARDRKGLTQPKLARALGIRVQTISRAENGNSVSAETAKGLCEFLGLKLEDVVIPRVQREGGNAA